MFNSEEINGNIVAMVSLASGIAANHPAMGQCQLKKLRDAGVPENQIETVIEIARHIRDEAAEKLDAEFDAANMTAKPVIDPANIPVIKADNCGCSTTPSGKSCC